MDRGYGTDGLHSHGQGVLALYPFVTKWSLQVDIRLVTIDENFCNCRTEMKNVCKCCLIVQGVEGIRSINHPVNMWKAEKTVYSNFTATFITCTELEWSYCILDIILEGDRYCSLNDAT